MESGGTIWDFAVSGTDLYVGGYFTKAGGVADNNIAKWNGSAGSALGSGMDTWVFDLAVSGTDLYAGGDFANAGYPVILTTGTRAFIWRYLGQP